MANPTSIWRRFRRFLSALLVEYDELGKAVRIAETRGALKRENTNG